MKSTPTAFSLAAAALLLFGYAPQLFAAPDLMVYPTRVVMSDRSRTAQVDIINTSQTQASYKITLVRKRMTETGEFRDAVVPEQDEKFADDIVKYSPRQVTLVPGAGQTIRIIFKPSADMAEGEYRSHILFSKVPEGITQLPEHKEEPNALSMKVVANIGVSVPVIVRHGQLQAQAAIDPSTVTLSGADPKQQVIAFTLSRSGTRSIYGEAAVYLGTEKVAISDGLAVYTPNDRRKVTLHLLDPYQLKAGDSVRVVFTERGERKPLAETTVVLP